MGTQWRASTRRYALSGKFTKDFKEESAWGLFFMLTVFVPPSLL